MEGSSLGIYGIYTAAFFLGAAHSLEPGHGKTVVAVYLAGSKGRAIDAVILGLAVTFTHSFSIILLGIAAKFTSGFFSDQELHAYLGLAGGAIILALGIRMILSLRQGKEGNSHGHSHSHDHGEDEEGHGSHGHTHDHGTEDHAHGHGPVTENGGGERQEIVSLLLLGVSGGIVPCPAALAILLAAVSSGNIGKGLVLVLIFSLGLAATLILIGLAVVGGMKAADRFMNAKKFLKGVSYLSAVTVTLIGVITLYSSISHFTGTRQPLKTGYIQGHIHE